MKREFKYWEVEYKEKDGIREKCIIRFKEKDVPHQKVMSLQKEIQAMEEKHEKLEKELNQNNITSKKRTELQNEKMNCANDCKVNKAKLANQEEIYRVYEINENNYLEIQRVKDRYSRKEGIVITLFVNKKEDARIATTISRVREDIRKLAEFGVYITSRLYDELELLIRDAYYYIYIQEREYIDNDIPTGAVEEFVEMCHEQIQMQMGDEQEDSKKEIVKKDGCYCIPVKIFQEWYDESPYRRFPLKDLKEALKVYGYTKCNTGRLDYTVAGKGKVIALRMDKLEGEKNE